MERSADVPKGFIDARNVEDGSELVCDVCVVGSGAAGTTLALRLRDRGRSVLLLEAGGPSADVNAPDLYALETSGLPISPKARERALGGTTNSWVGRAAMLEETDFGPRPWLGVPAWPINRAELLPYYAEGCRMLGVPDLTTATVDRFSTGRGFLLRTPELQTVMLFPPKKPRRFREMLESAVRADTGLKVFLFANVTRLVPAAGSGIEFVDIRTLSGRSFRLRPRSVVLACGGIENARLMLFSGDGDRVGTGRALGRYYMDHPVGRVGLARFDQASARLPHPGYWDSRRGRFEFGIRLSPARQAREGLLDCYIRFHTLLESEGRGAFAARQLFRDPREVFRSPRLLPDLVLGAREAFSLARFKALNRGRIKGAAIHNFLEQAPRAENRVTLSERLDPFGNPLARVDWSIGELDRRSIRALHAALDEDLRRRGLGCVESPLLSGDDEPWPISRDYFHHMGTTRMGDDPSTSVVDRNCRVHGMDNAYVAGSSVFSTSGYANPTLTIIALTLRLGDHLAEQQGG